jgi:hypothetical protein
MGNKRKRHKRKITRREQARQNLAKSAQFIAGFAEGFRDGARGVPDAFKKSDSDRSQDAEPDHE